MPTLTVIKHFDVIKNIAAGFFPSSVDLFFIRSRFNNWKKLSATALSCSYRDGSCSLQAV
jgi:hypothetical protein